MRYMYIPYK